MLRSNLVKFKVSISQAVILAAVVVSVVLAIDYFVSASSSRMTSGGCGDNICGPVEKANPNICPKDCSGAQPITAFIAVHMEVGGGSLTYTTNMWPKLVSLVSLADTYGFKLTLEFNPQWATYILQDQSKLTLLRSWGADGHEIALHHHGPSHPDWNGYTNREDKKGDPKYRGTISEMMSLIKRLPATGKIFTAGATDENIDWASGVIYDTNGGTAQGDLLSTPVSVVWNGFNVTQLKHRMYATGVASAAPLSEIEAAYASVTTDQIMGIVFHVHDYDKRKTEIERLFSSFNTNNVDVKTVKDILSNY